MIKSFKRLLVILSLVLGVIVISDGLELNVSAKTVHHIKTTKIRHKSDWTLKSIPRRFWGTWYFYRGHNVFNLMKVNQRSYTNMFYSRRYHKYDSYRSYIKPQNDSDNAKLPSWKVLKANGDAFSAVNAKVNGHSWLITDGWYGAGGDEYQVTNLGHHQRRLTETSGAGFWSPANAYSSKALARQNYRK